MPRRPNTKNSKLVYVPAGVNLYKVSTNMGMQARPPVIEYCTLKKPKDLLILEALQDKMRVLYEGQEWYVNRKDTYGEE